MDLIEDGQGQGGAYAGHRLKHAATDTASSAKLPLGPTGPHRSPLLHTCPSASGHPRPDLISKIRLIRAPKSLPQAPIYP